MEQMTSIPYTWSDSWLLLSVVLAGSTEGATIEGLLSVGDGINHAIFTFPEIDGGLARLLAGEFVRIDGERVFPTSKAIEIYKSASKDGEGSMPRMEDIGRKLGAPSWSPTENPNKADPSWSLARFATDELKGVHTRFKREFATAISRLERQGR